MQYNRHSGGPAPFLLPPAARSAAWFSTTVGGAPLVRHPPLRTSRGGFMNYWQQLDTPLTSYTLGSAGVRCMNQDFRGDDTVCPRCTHSEPDTLNFPHNGTMLQSSHVLCSCITECCVFFLSRLMYKVTAQYTRNWP